MTAPLDLAQMAPLLALECLLSLAFAAGLTLAQRRAFGARWRRVAAARWALIGGLFGVWSVATKACDDGRITYGVEFVVMGASLVACGGAMMIGSLPRRRPAPDPAA